jgi:hypothetical protein
MYLNERTDTRKKCEESGAANRNNPAVLAPVEPAPLVLVVVLPPVVFAPAFDRKRLRRLHGFLDEVEEPVNDREVVVPPILFLDQIEQVAGPSQPGGCGGRDEEPPPRAAA